MEQGGRGGGGSNDISMWASRPLTTNVLFNFYGHVLCPSQARYSENILHVHNTAKSAQTKKYTSNFAYHTSGTIASAVFM